MSAMNEKYEIVTREGKLPMTDDMMAKAAGGESHYPESGDVPTPEQVKFLYNVGDRVEVRTSIFSYTKRGTITRRYIGERDGTNSPTTHHYAPLYEVRCDDGKVEADIPQDRISY